MNSVNDNLTIKMALETNEDGGIGSIDTRHGYYMMFSSMLFFQLLNWTVARVGSPKSVREDPWRWKNLFISWFHALICGTWDLLCFVLYPEILDDLITTQNYFTYLMVPFSTGYFLYDSIDMYVNNKLISNWEVTLHHIAVISMFWYNFHAGMCIGYNCLALMAEINSFFLHSRKLLQMIQTGFDHWFYRIVTYLNLFTFVSCRGFSISRIIYGMMTESHRVPAIYYYCLSCSMLVMTVINCVLFWRLFNSDILKPQKVVKLNGNSNKYVGLNEHEKDE